jgi:MerR family transcriptional regulator/heat shock protein HspR
MKRRKGYYSISVVAKMFSVHQQTIRMYEKQGLLTPKRSGGNTRLFSEEDVDRLEEVIYLTHKLGVNLAGVEMILRLQKKIKRMQEEMNKMFHDTEGEFEQETAALSNDMKRQVERLVDIKRDNQEKKRENLIEIPSPDEAPLDTLRGGMAKKKAAQRGKAAAPAERPASSVKLLTHTDEEKEEPMVDDIEIDYDDDK